HKVLKANQTFSTVTDTNILLTEPIQLLISDEGKGKYYYRIRSFCASGSNRIEKRIAQRAADQLLQEFFKNDSCAVTATDVTKFQNSDGGIGQVQWGGSNLET